MDRTNELFVHGGEFEIGAGTPVSIAAQREPRRGMRGAAAGVALTAEVRRARTPKQCAG